MLPRVFLSLITSHLAGLHRSTAVLRREELFYRTADRLVVKHFGEEKKKEKKATRVRVTQLKSISHSHTQHFDKIAKINTRIELKAMNTGSIYIHSSNPQIPY